MIREIALPADSLDGYKAVQPDNRVTGLSTLNVFIGPNNSGKSRLLRGIFATKYLRYSSNSIEMEELRELIALLNDAVDRQEHAQPGFADNFPHPISAIRGLRCPLYQVQDYRDNVVEQVKRVKDIRYGRYGPFWDQLDWSDGRTILDRIVTLLSDTMNSPPNAQDWHRLYIPVLRGLRPLDKESDDDVYRQRTVHDYFSATLGRGNAPRNVEEDPIVTGLTIFSSVRRFLLGTLKQRKAIRDYERFLGQNFFNGHEVTLVPREGSDVLYVKIGGEAEKAIYDIGDGVQQIIIQTLPLVLHADKNLVLFIEEPEMFLHPGYQRLLIERFLDTGTCEGRQIFVATHSQQFLDMTLDHSNISVYRVAKKPPEQDDGEEWTPTFKVNRISDDHHSVLRELGVHNSSLLLANCTIWVEGITDRMYFRHFLHLLQDEEEKKAVDGYQRHMEDIHFAFVEYSGGNITHWSFLDESESAMKADRLCGELFLIADRDKGKEKRHQKLKEYLKDRVYILKCREVENLLTPDVIKKVIQKYETHARFQEFKQSDYKGEFLGSYIEKSVFAPKYQSTRKGGYAGDSGTIKDKARFAEYAIAEMKAFDDLSNEAQSLAKRILEFIRDRNPAAAFAAASPDS